MTESMGLVFDDAWKNLIGNLPQVLCSLYISVSQETKNCKQFMNDEERGRKREKCVRS